MGRSFIEIHTYPDERIQERFNNEAEQMMPFSFDMPTVLHFGSGVSTRAGAELSSLLERSADLREGPAEPRVLVVTDEGIQKAGLLAGILDAMSQSELEYAVFSNVQPNPRDTTVHETAGVFNQGEYNAIVAIGGGSVIDAAKGAALVATHGGSIRDYEGWETRPVGPIAPLLAIPTTAGTGSEVGSWAVITVTSSRAKINVGHRALASSVALVDPLLTHSLPKNLTVATGFDALTHAVEAYTCRRANPISDAFALEAIGLVAGHLRVAAADGEDAAARGGMMLASTLAGIAMDQSELGGVHCLSESLGGLYDAPHGLLNAILLPYVMAHNAAFAPGRYARIAEALGDRRECRERSGPGGPSEAVSRVVQLSLELEVPPLALLGARREDFSLLSERAAVHGSNASNPEPLTPGEYQTILEQALAGDLPV